MNDHPVDDEGAIDEAPGRRDATGGGRRAWTESLLVLAPWLILAAIPVVAAVRAVQGRWTPVSDWGMIGAWSWDSLSWPPPLLGMPTSLSQHTTEVVSHPGPLLFWALAIPTRVFGAPGYGIVIGSALINIVFLGVIARGLHTIGGRRLSLAGAVAVGITMMSLGADAWREPYNPLIAILPLLAMLVSAWAVIRGEHRWLIAMVGAGSFAAQAHTSYLPVVGLIVVAVVVHLATGMFADVGERQRSRPSAKVLTGSVLVGLICWSGPLFDQFFRSGNLWRLVAGGTEAQEHLGLRYGLERLVDAVSVPPWWWTGVPGGELGHPSAFRLTVGLVAAALVIGLIGYAWRRDRTVAGSLVVGLLAATGGVLASALIPVDPISLVSTNNRYYWLPLGLYLWIAVANAIIRLVVVPALDPAEPSRSVALDTAASAVGTLALVVVAVVAVSGSGPKHDGGSAFYGPIRQYAQELVPRAPENGYIVKMDSDQLQNNILLQGIIAQLTMHGVHVGIPSDLDDPYGVFTTYQAHRPATGREDTVILVRTGAAINDPPPGFCEVSRYDPADPWPVYRGYNEPIIFFGSQQTAVFLGDARSDVDDPPSDDETRDLCAEQPSG